MDQPMLTANPELTIDEASILAGLAIRDGHTELGWKMTTAIVNSTSPLAAVKAIELNKPTIRSTPTEATPLAPLGTLATGAVDETAGIGGSEGGEL